MTILIKMGFVFVRRGIICMDMFVKNISVKIKDVRHAMNLVIV